jgi:uncharacterized protein (UPF0264 family)
VRDDKNWSRSLNIKAVRDRLDERGYERLEISTNIGEQQTVRSMACQAALGVATAGADYIKCGLATLSPDAADYLGDALVRTVKSWYVKKTRTRRVSRGGVSTVFRSPC